MALNVDIILTTVVNNVSSYNVVTLIVIICIIFQLK